MDLPTPLEDLLKREDDSVEWKKTGKAEEVVRKLSAFANSLSPFSKGGWVLCGVEEVKDEHGFPLGQPVGLDSDRLKEMKGAVLSSCRSHVSPPLFPQVYEEALPEDSSRRVLIFYIGPSREAHTFATKGDGSKYWIMSDSSTVEARGEALRRLLAEKDAAPPFLNRPCSGAGMEDLNRLAADEFLSEAHLPRPAADYLEPDVRLDAITHPLVVSVPTAPGATKPVPTNLALLLFGREPTHFLPGAYASLSVYEGVSRSETNSRRFQAFGPIPKLIRDLLEKLRLYTGIEIDKSASALEIRQNRPRYSAKALQEAVVNAFAHRDYESHEPVQITVFEDRIEISNPGGSLSGASAESPAHGNPRWRNPALAGFLLKMSLAQREGQGIPTIFQETLAISGQEPTVRSTPVDFTLILPAPQSEPEPWMGSSSDDGLILVSIGADSVLPFVEESLDRLGIQDAQVLVDLDIPEYVPPGAWEKEAKKIRNRVKRWVDDPRFPRLHLFYRGPVVLAPLLGALIRSSSDGEGLNYSK